MSRRNALRVAIGPLTMLLVGIAFAGCGDAAHEPSASALLTRTFSRAHAVHSGQLALRLTVAPAGSRVSRRTITLTVAGPFQRRGPGRVPASDLSITVSGRGSDVRLGLVSTGVASYLSIGSASYRLAAASSATLAASFASVSGGSGIHPLSWIVAPSLVPGIRLVAAARTREIRGGVDVPALLGDLRSVLHGGRSGAAGEPPPAQAARVAVWTGTADSTVRRLQIVVTLPVSGVLADLLGGSGPARLDLTLQYAALNRPQTIEPPRRVSSRPAPLPALTRALARI